MIAALLALSLACSSGEPSSPPEPTAAEPDPTPPPSTVPAEPATEDVAAVEAPAPEEVAGTEAEAPATGEAAEAEAVAVAPVAAETPAKAKVETTAPAAAAEEAAAEEATVVEAPAAAATVQTYAVGASSGSQLYVQVFKDPDTAAAGMSHDHVVVARGWTGTVRWHPTDAGQCSIEITLPVAKLEADTPAMRKAVGYEGELSDSQRETVKKNLLAADQLDGASHPEITYRSRSCSGTTGAVTVVGDLTIRGKTKSVTTTLQVSLEGGGFSATGSFKAKHSDFGFQPYTAMLGALKNQDQMKFTLRLKG